jgi:hypothetical protein
MANEDLGLSREAIEESLAKAGADEALRSAIAEIIVENNELISKEIAGVHALALMAQAMAGGKG